MPVDLVHLKREVDYGELVTALFNAAEDIGYNFDIKEKVSINRISETEIKLKIRCAKINLSTKMLKGKIMPNLMVTVYEKDKIDSFQVQENYLSPVNAFASGNWIRKNIDLYLASVHQALEFLSYTYP